MDRPDNGYLIVPRVDKLEDGSYTTLIRRLTFVNGFVAARDLMSKNGEWVNYPDDNRYPEECFFISSFSDRKTLDQSVYNWPKG